MKKKVVKITTTLNILFVKITRLNKRIVLIALLAIGVTNAQSTEDQRKKRPSFEQLLEKMDANEDKMLSAEEVKGPLKEQFKRIDKDEDGFITAKEFENAPKPTRKGRIPSRR